jgi:hypothetical protein
MLKQQNTAKKKAENGRKSTSKKQKGVFDRKLLLLAFLMPHNNVLYRPAIV